MKTPSWIAAALIIVGIIVLAYQGFSYTTTEKAVDLGPLQITAEKEHRFPMPPVVGAVAIVGGVLILVLGRRGR